jgi:hypothetical protein
MRRALALILTMIPALVGAVENGQIVVTWKAETDTAIKYEFRWKHFAQPEWQSLGTMAGGLGTFTYSFEPIVSNEKDLWVCVDARQTKPTVGAWLSTTEDGAACNQFGSVIPLPPPPPPQPPQPPPQPPPPPPPPIEVDVGQLKDRAMKLEEKLAAIKQAVCSMTFKANTLGRKLQEALGGCK